MISALIFAGHLFFILYIFTKKWQEDSLQSAFINAGLIVLLFSVGWSISTMVLKVFVEQAGFGIYFDRDAMSLTLLTIAEYFFYKFYYGEIITEAGKET
ncbi:MAG: hypothetical protein M5R37_01515 [Melioribacteraceae bacterium]|nr:hypothetical protein [Melioribacteraceae bacterium]